MSLRYTLSVPNQEIDADSDRETFGPRGTKGVFMKSILRIALVMAAITVGAFCADNTLGTWKLNPDKSKPPAGQSKITSLILVREASGDGVRVTGKGEREDKSKIDISYTAKYDGK